jgi:PAS domain S-box-containing protein
MTSDRQQLLRIFLGRIRPIAGVLGSTALFSIWLLGPDDRLLRAAAVAMTLTVLATVAYLWVAKRVSYEFAMRMSVYVDVLLVALVVGQLDPDITYASAYMWPIALAAMLCTPRDTFLVTLASAVATMAVPIARGADDYPDLGVHAVIIGAVGVMIAFVRRDEHVLARSRARLERQLRDAQRLAHLGSWEWDPTTDVATWSDEMYRILGMEGSEPLGQASFLDLVPDAEREWVLSQMAKSVSGPEPIAFDFTIRRVDTGEVRSIHGLAEPIFEDGQLRVLGSLQDVTEQRRLESMRDEFVAAASHELRTPTSIVAGFASTLASSWENFEDAERLRFVREIDHAAQRLAMLIEDVLQVSQIESGNLRCEHSPFDVVEEASDLVRSWPGELPIELDINGGEPAVALGDAVRTRQVLTNLLANAERHTPPGTRATVRVRLVDEQVEIAVADTGPGIGREDQGRIFERFVRIDHDAVGTGLGLYLSRKLAEAQGGALDVESEPGRGATFTLSLPAAAGRLDG